MHNPVVQTLNYLNLCVLFLFVFACLEELCLNSIIPCVGWSWHLSIYHLGILLHVFSCQPGYAHWAFWLILVHLGCSSGSNSRFRGHGSLYQWSLFSTTGLMTLKPHPSVLYRDVICTLSTCQWSCGSSEWYHTISYTWTYQSWIKQCQHDLKL